MSVEGFLLKCRRIRNPSCMYQLLPKNPDEFDFDVALKCLKAVTELADANKNIIIYTISPPWLLFEFSKIRNGLINDYW